MKKQVSAVKRNWYIWLFPFFALVMAGYLFYDYYHQRGPTIKIVFDDASGLTAEKTRVRFRGVTIGAVRDVYISEDQKDVVAEVLLRRDAKDFAVKGSRFTLVTPKVNFQGVSGLDTIFEGTYIVVAPGPKDGEYQEEFKASNSISQENLDDTSSYILETASAENISPGDSITYRGMKIGSVTKLLLTKEARSIQIQINVENRFVKLIRANTNFWAKVGVQAKGGIFSGLELKMNSLESIMNGGIEIATPDPAGAMAKGGQKFPLLSGPPKEYQKWNPALN